MIPFLQNQLHLLYLLGVMGINSCYLISGFYFLKNRDDLSARKVLKASLLYQPILLIIIFLDIVI